MKKHTPSQLIVIDPTVADIPQLLQQLPSDSKAVILTDKADQVCQISTLLRQYHRLEALHIVTHGSPGALHFSNATLSGDRLNQYWDDLAGWSASMNDNADILLYGCETGKGTDGESFIKQLSDITGLNTLASSHILGHPAQGGSWMLDKMTMQPAHSPLFINSPEQLNWQHTLSTTLTPGDMVAVDFNITESSFRLAALTDIASGTVIKITDRGWTESDTLNNNSVAEGTIVWTVGTAITAGETFQFSITPGTPSAVTLLEVADNTNRNGEITTEGTSWSDYSFTTAGDQILIYQGTDASPTFIYGLTTSLTGAHHPADGEWQNTTDPSATVSQLPPGLTNGSTALALTVGLHLDNYAYTGPVTTADKATWLTRLSNTSNWTGDNAVKQTGVISATAGDSNAQLAMALSNPAPTLTSVSTLNGATEDTEFEITQATLNAAADENDSNGTVDGFIVKAVSGGTLKIGADADSATAWSASTNNLIDASNKAYWTPANNDNGDLNAFTVVAVDNEGAESTTPVQVVVNATAVNDAPTVAINTGSSLLEGAVDAISDSELKEGDIDDSGTGLTYTITTDVLNGELFLDADSDGAVDAGEEVDLNGTFTQDDIDTGKLKYSHDGGESTSDSFIFDLEDGREDGSAALTGQTFNFTITGKNDAPTLATNTGSTLNEGDVETITTAELNEGDPDDSGANLTYTVTTATTNGSLWVDTDGNGAINGAETALTNSNTFTQADIDNGLLKYAHNGDETTSDSFVFSLEDDDNATLTNQTYNFTVTGINDEPTLTATGSGATYIEGSTAVSVFNSTAVNTVETGQNISSIELTISNISGDGSTEHITLDGSEFALNSTSGTAGSFGYSVALNTGTKVATITITKADTAANYQTLIDGIQYRNSGSGLDGNNRVFSITEIQDNGGVANGGDDTANPSGGSAVTSTIATQAAPTITDATYDYSTNQLVVTGTDFVSLAGTPNDVDISTLTLTGETGQTYTLTSTSDVEIDSSTQFTVTLSGADLTRVEALLNKDGPNAESGTVYNIAAADNWMTGAESAVDITDSTNALTVSNYAKPEITGSAYNFSTGVLVITGTNFVSNNSGNDVDVTQFTFTGESGATYTLTADTSNVNITSDTEITITLGAIDKLSINGLLNSNAGSSDGGTTYNLAAADNWLTGVATAQDIADATSTITVSGYAPPEITSATYDSDTGELVVTGTNFVKSPGSANDIDISTITITGEAGSFEITSTADVEITSTTSFTVTLSGADKDDVDTRLNQLGTSSSGGTPYNIAVADNWLAGAPDSVDISDTTANGITVQIPPKITSASYDASTGHLVVTGTNIQEKIGVNNYDIDASTFTITGEGGQTYTLIGTPDVERTSSTAFTLQLDAADKAAVNLLLNKNGTASTGGTTFNLAAGDDWNTEVTAGDISDATNAITVSSVPVPEITSATYDASTGSLVVTGTDFLQSDGTTNDIDVSKLSLSGEGSESYTLTSDNVEIGSATSFTVTLNATDQAAVALFLNKDGTASTSGTTYNLAAAEDWAAGADAAVTVADLTGNGVTVSHTPTPTITSATYNGKTGVLVVTGTSFLKKGGAANDIDITRLTITGEGGGTHTLTSNNVDITSATEFTATLNAADQTAVADLLNKAGTTANGGTTYNLNAAEDWAAGADAAVNVVDATGNGITVTLNSAPTSADATQSTDYNSSYTFQVSDFAFSDTDSRDTLQEITIRTLPVEGDLYLNSTAITAVDTTVTLAELSAGNLIFTPDNGGTGDNYASFTFTVNDGSDDSVATNTMTLNVGAAPTSNPTPTPAPTPTPTPTPTPEPEPETVDGVTINREQETNAQGDSITVIRVDPVPQDRQDTDTTTTQADLPLHFADDEAQQVVTRISLPNGVGVQARANEDARAHNQNLDLIELIRETAGTDEDDNDEMQALGQNFLDQLGDSREQVWVNQIDLEQSNNRDNEDEPIILTGSPDDNDQGYQEAIVINMRQLPSGTQLVLNDIEFAVIVGEDKVIRGGDGANTVFAGAGSQDIVLGADDDELHGGAGNDIVGSKGGNDLLNGDDGDDLVVGGFGHDTLNGGDGNDQLQGGQQEAGQFTFSLNDESEIVTHYTPDSTDLSDVGAASFTGDWYSTPVYLDEHAHTQSILMTEDNRDNVEKLNVILQAGEHYAFMAEDPARLKAIAILYTAVVGERPDLSVLNHYATGDQSLSELSDLALSYWRTQKSIDEHTATDTQVRAVLDTFWSFGYLTQENIATAIDQINQGGSWSELFLQTAQHANSDALLKNDTGTLQLAKTEHVDDHGISWDVGHDQLDGGAGDDILIGGHGNDQLIGGEGYDTARQLRKTSDYDIKLNEDGLITLVYQNGIYQETDALQGVEQVAFADALINFSATNLEGNELKLLTTLSQLVTGEALDLELLNQYQSGDLSQSQLVNNLMSTEGYLQQWSTLDNYQFVEQITETVFGQPLDTPDLAYWANRLDTDLSRAEGFELIATHQDYQDQLQQAGQLLIG